MGQSNSTPSSSSPHSNSNSSSSALGRSSRRAANNSPSAASPSTLPHSSSSTSTRPLMNSSSSSSNPGRSPQQQQQQPQQQSSSSSRVLRATTERRRRANLFSSFYPLLSRGSSSNASQSAQESPNPAQSTSTNTPTSVSRSNSPRVNGDVHVHVNATQRPDRPPSRTGNPPSRASTRSPALQAQSPSSSSPSAAPTGRTPRGLSRVQRMYDEQSIRSTRSSSRASSLIAVTPPASAPTTVQASAAASEPMDVDLESVGQPARLPLPPQNSHLLPLPHDLHPTSAAAVDHSQIPQQEPNTGAPYYVATRTRSRSRATAASIASGSDNMSLYTGLSNPRGGTSISSSLLPIRPDSDDDMDDLDMEQDAPSHGHSPRTRGIGADLVADLIRRQLDQSLAESGHYPAQSENENHVHTPSLSARSPAADDAQSASSEDRNPPSAHRRRLRSSSMRGLLGFQPTDTLAAEERSEETETTPSEGSTDTRAESNSAEGGRQTMSEEQFEFMLGFPFLTRLLASSRLRPESPSTPTAETATSEGTSETSDSTGAAAPTATPADETNSPSIEPNSSPRPRRHNATIRFIQIGGGIGHRHRQPGTNRDGTAGRNEGEEVGEAIIMYLSGPSTDSPNPASESGDSATAGSEESTESDRPRPRTRSPWIILTLSGPYLSNLMSAGADNEGGVSYDDLWMLSNLIGPARPITTTQEAIDRAGFAVGRFEQDYQGIKDVVTLGDGSRCLVCMSEYEEGEDMRALKCKHGFHQECIDKWLTTGANKCPVCRAAAVVSEPPSVEPEVTVNPSLNEE
ncbi:hypothetical protein EMPS_11199 [Entomortierella parvispora]|uniref:RING-type domain-containing protein n=1 Tax=Entomortierella parvispora TaxID=205924 RepID=A0A9P3HL96_9FUNG|nr:hypothetical protein EMPS_11199 [Entomortierella parvispora]